MAALTSNRNTPWQNGPGDPNPTGVPGVPPEWNPYPVAAGAIIYRGALVGLQNGYAVPMSATSGVICVGFALQQVNNSGGASGAASVTVQTGVSGWNQLSTSITQANVGQVGFAADDNNIALTGTSNIAGIIQRVDGRIEAPVAQFRDRQDDLGMTPAVGGGIGQRPTGHGRRRDGQEPGPPAKRP